MSMPTWLNDVHPLASNENGAFDSSVDPSASFLQTPTTASFDFNQLQNPQLQQRMQNGAARNGSPALINPVYQTQPLIPTKRSRPREDSAGASPRQPPGAPPASRSQTPQQGPYAGFQGSVSGGQPFQAAPPFQQFQHPSSNASLSPPLQTQQFNPQAVPQRMSTISPSPFSPAVPNLGSRASPAQSEHGSRVHTPQNGVQSYVQGMPYGNGPTQSFTPPLGSNNTALQSSQYGQPPPNIQNQQRIYEIRQRQLMQQLQASNTAAAQHRNQGAVLNPSPNAASQMTNYNMAARSQAQHAQQAMMRPNNPEQFIKSLSLFMQQRGLPLNPNPMVTGRPINVMQLFATVLKHGGFKKVTMTSQWTSIASMLAIPPAQYLTAAQEIQEYWHTNLSAYEAYYVQNQQQQRQQQAERIRMTQQMQNGNAPQQDQFSPVKQANAQLHDQHAQQLMHAQAQSQAVYQSPVKQMTPQQQDPRQLEQNGFLNSQPNHMQGRQSSVYSVPQPAISYPLHSTPPQVQQPTSSVQPVTPATKRETHASTNSHYPRVAPLGEVFVSKADIVTSDEHGPESHGGIQVRGLKQTIDDLLASKPSAPLVHELGLIDIRALTMSLRSGIHAEVRLALDSLASLSKEDVTVSLDDCEDLLEILMECADEQLELLAENAAEVSDAMLVNSYEETVRGCRVESETLQEVPGFGTLQYELDRSVDRLICITTILRNLSFFPPNQKPLTDPVVVKFITTVIRYLGTRNMLLRTHTNTLDFSKDIVVYLSNVSTEMDLPGKEEALCVLHFLLSFAPTPPPTVAGKEEVMFTSYDPSIHRYLPLAVDSLAKLLARDDPNRTFYRSIFLGDNTGLSSYELLTRTFGLAIAPMPEHEVANLVHSAAKIRARAATVAQGLLAAEILAGLIPSTEHVLARIWLSSQDGFAMSLIRIVSLLGAQPPPQQAQRHGHPPSARSLEAEAYPMICARGVALLRKLGERAKDAEAPMAGIPMGVLPKKESLLFNGLLKPTMDSNVVRQLCAFSSLDT